MAQGVATENPSPILFAPDDVRADLFRSHVQKRLSDLKVVRQPREKKWADAELAYRVERVRSAYNSRVNLILPMANVIVERIVPNIINQTVGRGPFFECSAKQGGEGRRKAKINESLLHNQLDDDEFRMKFTPFVREVVTKGSGVWKGQWAYDRRKCFVPVREDDPIGMGEQGFVSKPRLVNKWVDKVLKNRPSGGRVDPFRVFYDHMVEHEDLTDWLEEAYVTADWLLERAASGVFDMERVKAALASGPGKSPTAGYDEARVERASGGYESSGTRFKDRFHYLEFWGRIPESLRSEDISKGPTFECVGAIVNGSYVIRADYNPHAFQHKPFRIARILPVAGTLEGLSVLTINMSLIVEKNDKRNQALDNSTLANNPMLLDIGGNADKQSYRAGPGKVLHANGDTLKPFVLPDMAGGLYRDEAIINRDIEEAAGAPPVLSGQSQPGVGSATEFAGLTQNASVQIVKYAHAIEDTFLQPVLTMYHRLNQQFLPKDVAVRMVGEDGLDYLSIQREDTLVDLEFKVTGASSMQSKASLGAQWGVLLPRLMEQAMMEPGSVDTGAVWHRILKDVFAMDHPELLVRTARRMGPPRAPEEVFLLLTQGISITPDPRVDLYEQLKIIGTLFVQFGQNLPKPIFDHTLNYIEQATQVLAMVEAEKAAQATASMMESMGGKGPADVGAKGGGSSNDSKKGVDKDGKGMEPGRMAMKSLQGAA